MLEYQTAQLQVHNQAITQFNQLHVNKQKLFTNKIEISNHNFMDLLYISLFNTNV